MNVAPGGTGACPAGDNATALICIENVGVVGRRPTETVQPFWLAVSTFSTTLGRLIPSHIQWPGSLSTSSHTSEQAWGPEHRRSPTLEQLSCRDESDATVRRIAAGCRATKWAW